MKFELIIDPAQEERVTICAHERSGLAEEIERLVRGNRSEWIGYRGKSIVPLDPAEVCCFIAEDHKVFALVGKERLQVRSRLYQLEEGLGSDFIKINQSCIANARMIGRFEAAYSGALMVVFKNGYKDYVSRRQLKLIKERFGF